MMAVETLLRSLPSALEERALALVGPGPEGEGPPVRWVSVPRLRALKEAGTRYLYVDSADPAEMDPILQAGGEASLAREVDGNTTNQPLVARVLERDIPPEVLAGWARDLKEAEPSLSLDDLVVLLYSLANVRLARECIRRYGRGRAWEVSVELHTALADDPVRAARVAWLLARAVPGALVKVPFTPHRPDCLLLARHLERAGVRVNLTTTFSARQVAAAALLANPSRSNIFLGRLNQGLRAHLLGEAVALQAQNLLRRLRRRLGLHTHNIAASVREPRTLTVLAGVDAFTVPAPVLTRFLEEGPPPEEIRSHPPDGALEGVEVDPEVVEKVGRERIQGLSRVEPDYLAFLEGLRHSPDLEGLDGEGLHRRFVQAGFGDLFYVPTPEEWRELGRSKLPDLDSPLTRRLPLDTLYSLLAFADFARFQEEMDRRVREALGPLA